MIFKGPAKENGTKAPTQRSGHGSDHSFAGSPFSPMQTLDHSETLTHPSRRSPLLRRSFSFLLSVPPFEK
jgi:hypothetical protein